MALVLIPQSLAYAELAGLPAYYGLYASVLPPIAAALFASSPYLQTGPTAMTSVLTFGALTAVAQDVDFVAMAALLALTVGGVRVVIGMTRVGWIAYLMSKPVLMGFASGAAVLIIASQLPTVLGVQGAGSLLGRAVWALTHPGAWNPVSIGVSAVTAAIVLGSRRIHALIPGVLVAAVIGVGYSVAAGYSGSVVGEIPVGLPPVSLALPWVALPALLVPGVVIALVGFAEVAAVSRAYAAQDRSFWSPDREFLSQGLANVASGISGGFPVGGSFARSSVHRLAGGRTRWGGAVTGLVVLAFLPFAAVLEPLPTAVLGTIVIVAVTSLLQLRSLFRMIRFSWGQSAIAWTTFVFTLALAPRIDLAVLIGMALAAFVHLRRELRMHVRASFDDGTLRLQPIGVLFFASAPGMEQTLTEQLASHPEARRLVMDLRKLGRIDYSGAVVLQGIATEATQAGLEVALAEAPPQARGILRRVFGVNVEAGETTISPKGERDS